MNINTHATVQKIARCLSDEFEGKYFATPFCDHLAAKLLREFTVLEKNPTPKAGGFNPDDNTRRLDD